jgi:hypothetical protein
MYVYGIYTILPGEQMKIIFYRYSYSNHLHISNKLERGEYNCMGTRFVYIRLFYSVSFSLQTKLATITKLAVCK